MWMKTNNNLPLTLELDLLASSVVKGGSGSEEDVRKGAQYSVVVCGLSHFYFVPDIIYVY